MKVEFNNADINNIFSFLESFFQPFKNQVVFIEFRIIDRDGSVKRDFFGYDAVITRNSKVENFIKSNFDKNIYFGVLPRFDKKGDASSVKFSHVLWIDFDLHNELKDENDVNKIKNVVVENYKNFISKLNEINFVSPNVVVYSGKGFQCYWFLDNLIDVKKFEELEEGLLKFLKNFFPNNIDLQVKDPARIMRLPFTFNTKYSIPIKTEIFFSNIFGYSPKFFEEYFKTIDVSKISQEPVSTIEEISKIGEDVFRRRIGLKRRSEIINFFVNLWIPGFRNKLEIALVGLLMKNGVKIEVTKNIIKRICDITKDNEVKARLKNVEYHYKNRAKIIDKLTGISGIIDTIWEILNTEIINEELKIRPLLLELKTKFNSGELIKDDIEFLVKNKLKSFGLTRNIFEEKKETELFKTFDEAVKEGEKRENLFIRGGDLLLGGFPNVEFFIHPLIPKGSLIIIAGKPSSFKSLFSMMLGVSISLEKDFLGRFNVNNGCRGVLYLDMENAEVENKRRLHYIVSQLVKDQNEFQEIAKKMNEKIIIASYKPLDEVFNEIIKNPDLCDVIILDSFRRFLKGDESKSEDVNKFYKKYIVPLRNLGKTIILIHHLRKRRENEPIEDLMERVRGSSDIVAFSDLTYVLNTVEQQMFEDMSGLRAVVSFHKVKDRLGLPITDFSFLVEKDDKKQITKMSFLSSATILTLEEKIMETISLILREYGGEMTTKEIREAVKSRMQGEDVDSRKIQNALSKLVLTGAIIRVKKGIYKYNEKLLNKYFYDEMKRQEKVQGSVNNGSEERYEE